jgi:hypothetical protein
MEVPLQSIGNAISISQKGLKYQRFTSYHVYTAIVLCFVFCDAEIGEVGDFDEANRRYNGDNRDSVKAVDGQEFASSFGSCRRPVSVEP